MSLCVPPVFVLNSSYLKSHSMKFMRKNKDRNKDDDRKSSLNSEDPSMFPYSQSLSWSTHCPATKLLNLHAQLVTGRVKKDLRRGTVAPRTDITCTCKKTHMMFACIRT